MYSKTLMHALSTCGGLIWQLLQFYSNSSKYTVFTLFKNSNVMILVHLLGFQPHYGQWKKPSQSHSLIFNGFKNSIILILNTGQYSNTRKFVVFHRVLVRNLKPGCLKSFSSIFFSKICNFSTMSYNNDLKLAKNCGC